MAIKFGFKNTILSAILGLYSLPSTRAWTTGILSNTFNITNGTRQGCPLSPIFFALIMEPLAASIRSNPNISGILIGSEELKIALYATNLLLSLSKLLVSLPAIQRTLETFGSVSPYKMNYSKSNMINISLKTQISSLIPFS